MKLAALITAATMVVLALFFVCVCTGVLPYGDGGISVTGTVVDQSGTPVEGAVTTLHPPAGPDFDGPKAMRTFEDGTFFLDMSFRPQRGTLFTVSVEKPGLESVTLGPYEGNRFYDNVIVTLKPTAQPSTETDDKHP